MGNAADALRRYLDELRANIAQGNATRKDACRRRVSLSATILSPWVPMGEAGSRHPRWSREPYWRRECPP